jgi:hypothetical protein
LLILGVPANTDYASRLVGGLFAAVTIPAMITGFFARRSARVWSLPRLITTYVLILFAVFVLYAIGRMGKWGVERWFGGWLWHHRGVEKMLDALKGITDGRGSNMFLFTDESKLAADHPLEVKWVSGKGELVRLTD